MKVFIVTCALLSVALAHTVPTGEPSVLQNCFDQDSIACVQQTVYRRAREFFDQPSIQLFSGVSFARSNERAAKSIEPQVEQAATVQEREHALEDFLINRAKSFFTERKLTWDVATTGRAISNAIPEDIKESGRALIEEARLGKKVKLIKKLLPFLGLLKLKLAGLAVLTVAAIGAIAKTALATSFIAIALAGASFLSSIIAKLFGIGGLAKGGAGKISGGLGSLGGGGGGGGGLGGLSGLLGGGGGGAGGYSGGNTNVEEIVAYTSGGGSGGNGGWSQQGWSNQGWDEHGAGSEPVGHVLAYKGQRPQN